MPRTAASPRARGRILAVAGAAAALAGAGTAAAAGSAQAATIPAPGVTGHTPAVSTNATRAPLTPAGGPGTAVNLTAANAGKTGAKPAAKPAVTRARPASTRPAAAAAGQKPAAKTASKITRARHLTPPAAHGPARPYQMYDSVTPSAIPGGKAVATYADGPYAASHTAMHGKNVTWIDTNGTDPAGATVLDVEPGDATPAAAATWASHRLDTHPRATAVIYTMRSEWAAAQQSIATLPHWQQHHIRWWIADPTGTPHLVPGSDATQWYWGTHYDISTVNPDF
jgi:hypothetical protein